MKNKRLGSHAHQMVCTWKIDFDARCKAPFWVPMITEDTPKMHGNKIDSQSKFHTREISTYSKSHIGEVIIWKYIFGKYTYLMKVKIYGSDFVLLFTMDMVFIEFWKPLQIWSSKMFFRQLWNRIKIRFYKDEWSASFHHKDWRYHDHWVSKLMQPKYLNSFTSTTFILAN